MYKIKAIELRKALKEIELAEKNGFMFCESIFKPIVADGVFVGLAYSDIWEGELVKIQPQRKFEEGKNEGVGGLISTESWSTGTNRTLRDACRRMACPTS